MLYRAGHWHIYSYTSGQCVLCIRCTATRHDASTQWKRNPFAAKWHCVCSTTFHSPHPPSLTPQATHPLPHTHTHTSTVAPPLSATFLISAWAKTNENLCVSSWVGVETGEGGSGVSEGNWSSASDNTLATNCS